jgi:hypothetical protein
LKHCTALAKRIRKLRQEEMEIENQFGNNGEVRSYSVNFTGTYVRYH